MSGERILMRPIGRAGYVGAKWHIFKCESSAEVFKAFAGLLTSVIPLSSRWQIQIVHRGWRETGTRMQIRLYKLF